MSLLDINKLAFKERNEDAFGRLRVSNPVSLFDSQFTYDLQPLLYEQVTAEAGASIAYDNTNRNALMTFAATPSGGKAFMQSYEYLRYQPSRSQFINISFNFKESVTDTLKFVGYSDGINGFEFQNDGTNNQFVIYSSSDNGNQTITQDDWNIDKLNGTGNSRVTLDITKTQIFCVDFQALYSGRVRFGFYINGNMVYVHEVLNVNKNVNPYIAEASLPIRCGMTSTGEVSTTMSFTCSSASSEGGKEHITGYEFSQEGTVTAADAARTHLLSIRPKTTFNGVVNRSSVGFIEMSLLVTGTKPIKWELVVGQNLSGTTAFNDVNSAYSSTEYNTLGTLNGSPSVVIDSGYVAATNQARGAATTALTFRYPITLNADGAQRSLGTLSVLVTGYGGSSACRGSIKFNEVR